MRAPVLILCLPVLASFQSGCGTRPAPVAAVLAPAGTHDQAARRAAIRAQLAPLCPIPLTPGELLAAADLVDLHPDAAPVVGRGYRMYQETLICRGANR